MVSNPSLVFKAQLRSGETILVDDYLESYYWLNKNTPDDARVLSWCVRGVDGRGGALRGGDRPTGASGGRGEGATGVGL